MRERLRPAAWLLGLAGIVTLSGCVVAPMDAAYADYGYTSTTVYTHYGHPPQAPVEYRSLPPSARHVWVDGDWMWGGSRYDWRPGYWAASGFRGGPPRPHMQPPPRPVPPMVRPQVRPQPWPPSPHMAPPAAQRPPAQFGRQPRPERFGTRPNAGGQRPPVAGFESAPPQQMPGQRAQPDGVRPPPAQRVQGAERTGAPQRRGRDRDQEQR